MIPLDKSDVLDAARGRWREILPSLAGIDPAILDGKHHPCPKCGGKDRFSAVDTDAGALLCRHCFTSGNGDGLAALQWLTGCTFPEAIQRVADYLGIDAGHSQQSQMGNENPATSDKQTESTEKPTIDGKPAAKDAFQSLASKLVRYTREESEPVLRQFAEKPGITFEAVSAVCGAVKWPKSKKHGRDCVALKAIDFDAGSVTTGIILMRADGEKFPAYESLDARKSHMLKGSRDGWIIVGRSPECTNEIPSQEGETLAFPQYISGSDAAERCQSIIAVEGPSDLLSATSHLSPGWAVATNICGASARKSLPCRWLQEKTVYVIGDADKSGEEGTEKFSSVAANKAKEVRICRLPFDESDDQGKDLRDFIASGGNLSDLIKTAGEPIEPSSTADSNSKPKPLWNDPIQNFEEYVPAPGKDRIRLPLPIEKIRETILRRCDGWPKRFRSQLFVEHNGNVRLLDKPTKLFAWLGEVTKTSPKFCRSEGFHSREEVFESLKENVDAFDAIEAFPHFPPLEKHYYSTVAPETGNGDRLKELIDRLNPATPLDADALLALFVTPAWGAPGGKRPMFIITGEGRGSGKTTVAEFVGLLFGGSFSFSLNDNVKEIRSRLLTSDAETKRVAIFDNTKSRRLSSADLESLITADRISGHKMYYGEDSRPNTIVYILTVNGASLSKDMAQRSMIIQLSKPIYSCGWESETRKFIESHRQEIFADIAEFFSRDRYKLHRYSRWGQWEGDVLERLTEPGEVQAMFLERQMIVDVESEESSQIRLQFRSALEAIGIDPEANRVFISSKIAANWVSEAIGESISMRKSAPMLKSLINEGDFPELAIARHPKDGKRGFDWRGDKWDKEKIHIAEDLMSQSDRFDNPDTTDNPLTDGIFRNL